MSLDTARLLITCPDQRGIVAAVTGFIAENNGNVLELDQHTDPDHGEFFMRLEIELGGFGLDRSTFASAWQSVAERFDMRWRVCWSNETKKMAVLASKASHCVTDLLWRAKTGELRVEVPCVISNHPHLAGVAESFDVPFHHFAVTPKTKAEQEQQIRDVLQRVGADFIVLARYMQVLSPEFVQAYPERIINIHHSFLPAFAGASPYQQAYERGVKIIGATSHYVTEDLDQGPIIAQSSLPVGHRDRVDDLIRKGRDLERVVLASAVRLHVEDKTLVSQNKTVVFD
ncbi:MAG: formyltetrahydrofolate deformylase [Planctomycetes bacterium]|nr:formyltetrahydrofolate deformylase [Planctomycetota bacterium]